MRCFTTCPMANFALRIGGWRIADRAAWFSISMAKVLLRTDRQATHTNRELSGPLQESVTSPPIGGLGKNAAKVAVPEARRWPRLTRGAGAWTLRREGEGAFGERSKSSVLGCA